MKKILLTLFLILSLTSMEGFSQESHGVSLNGQPKYKKGFRHFDYVNPNAPKGGVLKRASEGSYDSLNPFVLKGTAAAGIGIIYDSLCVQAEDEPFSMYGLVAQGIFISPSNDYVDFRINKKARFNDGVKIKPEDVVFSFNILMDKGIPQYKKYYEDIKNVKKTSEDIVRFEFKTDKNSELPLIISQLPVLPKHFYEKNKFEANMTVPLGSGPYRVLDFKPGKFINYKRVENYWAKDLPVNKGRYNFDEIKYEYYRDSSVSLEAFNAGEYDFRMENIAKLWATGYKGGLIDRGEIIKEEIKHSQNAGMQGFVFNLRKKKFQNRNVRKALSLVFDFEWINKNLFYGQYKRSGSYFSNSELASTGLPSREELKILSKYKGKIPQEVFTEVFKLPVTNGNGRNRINIRKATSLLEKEGYLIVQGKRINPKTGENLDFELLVSSPGMERIALTYKRSLKRLGVKMEVKRVDTNQYYNRLRTYDFDMTAAVIAQSMSPGNEQRYFFSSKAADIPGTRNFFGIKNPVIDEIIEELITANGRDDLITHCKALDRVLLWNYYLIPHYHSNTHRIAYKKGLKHPKKTPEYGLGINSWWWEK